MAQNVMYQSPPMQTMQAPVDLSAVPGVVIHQVTQWADIAMEVVGGCYEKENKYKVGAMPAGARTPREHGEAGSYQPTGPEIEAMPEMMRVEEKSDLCCRITLAMMGGLNLRPMTLHYKVAGQDAYVVDRPCKCGGWICCPLEMTLRDGMGNQLGMAVEDFSPYCSRCCAAWCCCTFYTNILEGPSTARESLAHKYTLKTHTACCGRVNNCCGATCCKNDLIIDVLDPSGNLISTVTKTYAPGGAAACFRSCFELSNYVVEFPKDATAAQRALLMTGVFNVGFQLFEREGGDDN